MAEKDDGEKHPERNCDRSSMKIWPKLLLSEVILHNDVHGYGLVCFESQK